MCACVYVWAVDLRYTNSISIQSIRRVDPAGIQSSVFRALLKSRAILLVQNFALCVHIYYTIWCFQLVNWTKIILCLHSLAKKNTLIIFCRVFVIRIATTLVCVCLNSFPLLPPCFPPSFRWRCTHVCGAQHQERNGQVFRLRCVRWEMLQVYFPAISSFAECELLHLFLGPETCV